jgi:hypothetical protein
MSDTQPPLEYLVMSSKATLESFELSRLNRAANLRKELRAVVEEWIQAEVDARVARCLLECRRAQEHGVGPAAVQSKAPLAQLGMSFLSGQTHAATSEAVAAKAPRRLLPTTKARRTSSATSSARPRGELQPASASKYAAAALRVLEQCAERRPDAGNSCATENRAGEIRTALQNSSESLFGAAMRA